MRLFGMDIFGKGVANPVKPEKTTEGDPLPVAYSTRSYADPWGFRWEIPCPVDLRVYDAVVESIPFIDVALRKLSRMICPFTVTCDNEKLTCDGSPTPMLRPLDTVWMPVDPTFARTRTGVGTVPELIRTVTWPRLLVVRVIGVVSVATTPSIVTPPVSVTSDSWMS